MLFSYALLLNKKKLLLHRNNVVMCQYANVPITIRYHSAANWHIDILAH